MEIKDVKFEDVVYFQEGPGVRNWQFRDSGIKLINIRNLVDSELCLENTNNYLEVEEVENKYKHFLLNAGDFVMASSGVTWGKIAEVHKEHLPLCLNTSIIRLVSKDIDVLNKWYLYYYIKSPQFRRQIEKLITGSAQPNFGPSHLKKVFISLPDICNQREAVEQFTKIEAIIIKRQKEMELLDELIKARFVELFGDYHINDKGFESHKGSELFKFSSGKFLPEENRLDEGIPVYGGNGIAWYTDGSLIDYPTVIIGRVGAWCGNVHMVTEPVWITDNAIYIKEQKTNKFTLEFLTELMKVMDFHQYADFSGQPKITQKPLETLEYLTPPVGMQNEFTDFVHQVDKSKFRKLCYNSLERKNN